MSATTTVSDILAFALDGANIAYERDEDTFVVPLPSGHTLTIEADFNAAGQVAYYVTMQDATGTYIPGTERELVAPAAGTIVRIVVKALRDLAAA